MSKARSEITPEAVKEAHAAARAARKLADDHQRASRDAPADSDADRRGEELRRLAAEASATFEFAKQQARVAAAAKRREESVVRDGEMQARLRAEAQARRDAAAASPPPPRGKR